MDDLTRIIIGKLPDDWRTINNTSKGVVYVLQLEHGRFYVGHSRNLLARMKAHFTGRGSSWTKRHRPLKCVWVCSGTTETECQVASRCVELMGQENVRGGHRHWLPRDYYG
jgi:hypothetical protein